VAAFEVNFTVTKYRRLSGIHPMVSQEWLAGLSVVIILHLSGSRYLHVVLQIKPELGYRTNNPRYEKSVGMDLRNYTLEAGFGTSEPAEWFPSSFPADHPLPTPALLLKEIERRFEHFGYEQLLLISWGYSAADISRCCPPETIIQYYTPLTANSPGAVSPDGAKAAGRIVDFETWRGTAELRHDAQPHRSLLIVDRVLEYIWDLRPLLATIRQILLQRQENHLLLLHSPESDTGFRRWTAQEGQALLAAAGMAAEISEYSADERCALLSAQCSVDSYQQFLRRHDLPSPKISTLVITSEHPDFQISGGIGTAVYELEQIVSEARVGVLYCPESSETLRVAHSSPELICAQQFFSTSRAGNAPHQERVLQLLRQALLYYPDLQRVEYQDYGGIGVRLIQERESGFFPDELLLSAHCHGSHVYLEAAEQSWMNLDAVEIAVQEKIATERADEIVFPSQYLHDLYLQAGLRMPAANVEQRRYPFEFGPAAALEAFRPIDTVIFFGKQSRAKGYPDFLEAMVQLQPLRARGIREIIFLGRGRRREDETSLKLAELEAEVKISTLSGTRSKIRETLGEKRTHSLCVLPYRGDNHPYSILEVMAEQCAFVSYCAGGIPQIVPKEFHSSVLSAPNPAALASIIRDRLQEAAEERRKRCDEIRRRFESEQAHINEENRRRYEGPPASELRHQSVHRSSEAMDITLIVPAYNVSARYLRELCYGISRQYLKPRELLFVDDGSDEEYIAEYQTALRESHLPWRILRSDTNQGLAAARNRGLREVQTSIVVTLDPDGIPLPRYLFDIGRYFQLNPPINAVTPFLQFFADNSPWQYSSTAECYFRPLGEGTALGHLRNCFASANTGFRTDFLRQIGGWDQSDRSMWEDWALSLRMSGLGHRVGIIPRIGVLARRHPASRQQQYSAFAAQRGLARAVSHEHLPRFEALRILGLLEQIGILEEEKRALQQRITEQLAAGRN
jgi:GT2 family glycosyltransferase